MRLEPQWICDELVAFIRHVPKAFPAGAKSWSLALMDFFWMSGIRKSDRRSKTDARQMATVPFGASTTMIGISTAGRRTQRPTSLSDDVEL
jgi:hypothetical protein